MIIRLPHEVTYELDEHVIVNEVAASLLAQERLFREAMSLLISCLPGANLEKVTIEFQSVTQQSPLKEMLAAALYLTFQNDLEEEVPQLIHDMTGYELPSQYDTLATVLVMLIAIYGISALHKRIAGNGNPKSLKRDFALLLDKVAKDMNVSPEVIEEKIANRFNGNKRNNIIKSAKAFFTPAKRYNAKAITSSKGDMISRDAIQETPSEIDEAIFEPEMEEFELHDTNVEIRAHDRDRSKAGWYGIIQEVSSKRTKMHVASSIDPEMIFEKTSIRGSVLVVREANDDGEMVPKLYYLQSIHQ